MQDGTEASPLSNYYQLRGTCAAWSEEAGSASSSSACLHIMGQDLDLSQLVQFRERGLANARENAAFCDHYGTLHRSTACTNGMLTHACIYRGRGTLLLAS